MSMAAKWRTKTLVREWHHPKGDCSMRHIIIATGFGFAGLALVLGQSPIANNEREVRAGIDSYIAAFNKGDLDGLLAHFTADADFINDSGEQYKGKASLGELCKRSLVELKGQKLRVDITSLRFLRPDVALVDGKAELSGPDGTIDSGRFTAIWTKSGSKWLLSSVRDVPESPAAPETTAGQLQPLEWLVGDWAHEAPNFSVQVRGRWMLDKSFLLLEYTAKGKGNADLTVVQYFGWDPIDGVIRSWFFDSKGGYGG